MNNTKEELIKLIVQRLRKKGTTYEKLELIHRFAKKLLG